MAAETDQKPVDAESLFDELACDTDTQLAAYPGRSNQHVRESIATEAITRAEIELGIKATAAYTATGY